MWDWRVDYIWVDWLHFDDPPYFSFFLSPLVSFFFSLSGDLNCRERDARRWKEEKNLTIWKKITLSSLLLLLLSVCVHMEESSQKEREEEKPLSFFFFSLCSTAALLCFVSYWLPLDSADVYSRYKGGKRKDKKNVPNRIKNVCIHSLSVYINLQFPLTV